MRVISGTARGKKLKSLDEITTRPTLDRVKEALFNIIQFNIKNVNVLDLFSGSGALAIEALSRGAKHAVCVDHSSEAIKIIKQNLELTRLSDKAKVINSDYSQALKSFDEKFDIIFLDPPYETDFLEKSITQIIKLNLLTEDGFFIIETNDRKKVEEIGGLEIYDERKYGKVLLIFARKG